MEVMLLTLSVLTEAAAIIISALGQKRVELGLLDTRCQRDGAVDALHVVMEAPGPLATGMGYPTRPNVDDQATTTSVLSLPISTTIPDLTISEFISWTTNLRKHTNFIRLQFLKRYIKLENRNYIID
jgi:hypothetical protein